MHIPVVEILAVPYWI